MPLTTNANRSSFIRDTNCDAAQSMPSVLQNLALTSPQLLHRSQSHLFSTLVIFEGESGWLRAKRIVAENPSLLLRIQNIRIHDANERLRDIRALESRENTFFSLVDSLVNLKSVVLTGTIDVSVDGPWESTSRRTQEAIRKLLAKPGLIHVSLRRFSGFPASVFSSLREVKCLRLVSVVFTGERGAAIIPGSLNSFECITTSGLAPISPIQPQSLYGNPAHLSISNLQQTSVWTILKSESMNSALETLTICLPSALRMPTPEVKEDFSLSPFPSLQYLAIVQNIRYPATTPLLPRISAFILSEHRRPSLKVLRLCVTRARGIRPSVDYGRGWADFATVLSDITILPNLNAMRIQDSFRGVPSAAPNIIGRKIFDALEQTRERLDILDLDTDSAVTDAFENSVKSILPSCRHMPF